MSRLSSIGLQALAGVSLLAACAGPAHAIPSGERVGEAVVAAEIHPLDTIVAKPSDYFERTLLVEAKVNEVCQKAGCWMQVEDANGKTALVRWETGCGGKYAFPKDTAGERILIQGSFYPKEISPEDAEHMRQEAGGKLEVPEKGFEFNASAVVLLDRPDSALK